MSLITEDLYSLKKSLKSFNAAPRELVERLVISRGYYATYHYSKKVISDTDIVLYEYKPNKKGGSPQRYSSHQAVSQSLIRSKKEGLMQLGRDLKRYHDLRCKADYDIHLNITETDKELAEDLHNSIKQQLESYVNNYQLNAKVSDKTDAMEDIVVDSNTTVRLPRKTLQETKDLDVKRPSLKILK